MAYLSVEIHLADSNTHYLVTYKAVSSLIQAFSYRKARKLQEINSFAVQSHRKPISAFLKGICPRKKEMASASSSQVPKKIIRGGVREGKVSKPLTRK